jgi:hypothetical protein
MSPGCTIGALPSVIARPGIEFQRPGAVPAVVAALLCHLRHRRGFGKVIQRIQLGFGQPLQIENSALGCDEDTIVLAISTTPTWQSRFELCR